MLSSENWEPPMSKVVRRAAGAGRRVRSGALLGLEFVLLSVAVAVAGMVALVDVAALRFGYPPLNDQDWTSPVPLIVLFGTPSAIGVLLVLRLSRRPWVVKVARIEGIVLAASPLLGLLVLMLTPVGIVR